MKPSPLDWLRWLALLLFAPACLLADDDKNLIEAGKGIGQVRLGMTASQAKALPGNPSFENDPMAALWDEWYTRVKDGKTEEPSIWLQRANANLSDEGSVQALLVISPLFHTPAGVSTQSDPSAIWREFPDVVCSGWYGDTGYPRLEIYQSFDYGIAFLIQHDAHPTPGKPWGKCCAIIVLNPRQWTKRSKPFHL